MRTDALPGWYGYLDWINQPARDVSYWKQSNRAGELPDDVYRELQKDLLQSAAIWRTDRAALEAFADPWQLFQDRTRLEAATDLLLSLAAMRAGDDLAGDGGAIMAHMWRCWAAGYAGRDYRWAINGHSLTLPVGRLAIDRHVSLLRGRDTDRAAPLACRDFDGNERAALVLRFDHPDTGNRWDVFFLAEFGEDYTPVAEAWRVASIERTYPCADARRAFEPVRQSAEAWWQEMRMRWGTAEARRVVNRGGRLYSTQADLLAKYDSYLDRLGQNDRATVAGFLVFAGIADRTWRGSDGYPEAWRAAVRARIAGSRRDKG